MSVKGLELKCLKDQDSKVGGGSERNRSKEGKGKEVQGKAQDGRIFPRGQVSRNVLVESTIRKCLQTAGIYCS